MTSVLDQLPIGLLWETADLTRARRAGPATGGALLSFRTEEAWG